MRQTIRVYDAIRVIGVRPVVAPANRRRPGVEWPVEVEGVVHAWRMAKWLDG